MKPQITRIGLPLLLTLGLVACDNESRTRTPPTQVNVVHAAPSYGNLNFRRVQRLEQILEYQAADVFSWDTDTYRINIEAVRPSSTEPEPVRSFNATLTAGNDYTIILGELASGALRELVIETERVGLSGTDTEITLVHSASTLGPVDVYLESPGATLAAATPRGTLDFRENLPPFNAPEGDYEVSLTEVGNPANVLLTSSDFGLNPLVKTVITLLDGANVGIAPYVVLLSALDDSRAVADQNLQAGIRAINAMTSGGALDVTIDSNFTPPLLPAVPVGVPSAYAFFDAGTVNLTVSPAGNPGVLEIDEEFDAENGVLGTWFIAGDPGDLTATFSVDDGRIIPGEARLDIYNGSVNAVDVFVVTAGTDINTVTPSASAGTLLSTPDVPLALDDLEITIRQTATTNVLAGPLAVTIATEGNYGILLTDSVGGAGIDITLLDDFN